MILCAPTQSAAFHSDHSGQSPLGLNHIEPDYKDKAGSVPSSRLLASNPTVTASAFLGIYRASMSDGDAVRKPRLRFWRIPVSDAF